MRHSSRALALLTVLSATASSLAGGGVRLSAFPELAVADARSVITLTAEVRDSSGKPAPDGTRVLFQTTLGTLREASVTTKDGYARVELVAGSSPGNAKVTASAISLGATVTTEIEFVKSGSDVSRARSYAELEAPRDLKYSLDYQIVSASGENQAASIKLGNLHIKANDIQVDVANREMRARKARLTAGEKSTNYEELYLSLDTKKGYGTTTYAAERVTGIEPMGRFFRFTTEPQERLGVVEVFASGEFAPTSDFSPRQFEFVEAEGAQSIVSARRALIYPGREIQFHRASLQVAGTRVMSVPLYRIDLQAGSPISFGEQVLTFNGDRVGVDYPHYLSMEPGKTSLLRFRTGQRYGRMTTGSGGAFLDYEMKWDKGDSSQGGLVLSGLTTPNEAGLDVNQFLRMDDGSTVNALVSVPARNSVFGSLGYSKPVGDYQLSLDGSINRSLRGPESSGERLGLVLESNPRKLDSLPLTLFYGVTANQSNSRSEDRSDSASTMGARLRGTFDTFRFGRSTTLAASFALNQYWGSRSGTGLYGSLGLNHSLGNQGSLTLGYEYAGDNSVAALGAGKQRLSLLGNYRQGQMSLNVQASKSLDSDWTSLYVDGSYRMSDLYRLVGSYTLDEYFLDRNLDYTLGVYYRLGIREIGLTWSKSTNRIGLDFLGARF